MRILKGIGRFFAVLGIVVAFLLLVCISAIFLLEKGPSESAKALFVQTVREFGWGKEGGTLGFIPEMFLTKEEIREIVERGKMKEIEEGEINDTDAIVIDDDVKPEVEVIDVTGSTFRGKLMIISDPSKVFLGTVESFGYFDGEKVDEMISRYEGNGYSLIGGVNGGDFIDGGANNSYTAYPLGAVMSEGNLIVQEDMSVYHVCGFTEDNKFVMGNLTLDEIKEHKFRDFVYTVHETGPFLVMNGEALVSEVPDTATYGGGKNPRTAIGQRKDGTVLLLAVDGRQAASVGATFIDLANVMLEYGAYNACAMDGGTSTQMFYKGELVSNPYSAYGVRRCPTAWLVKE